MKIVTAMLLGFAIISPSLGQELDPATKARLDEDGRKFSAQIDKVKADEVDRVKELIVSHAGKPLQKAAFAKKVEVLVRASMKDPESTRFQNIKAVSVGGAQAICGEYNSKNPYGGYPGFRRFIADSSGLITYDGERGTTYQVALAMTGNQYAEMLVEENPAITALCGAQR